MRKIETLNFLYSVLADLLPTAYEKEERGKMEIKGKGEMTTFWINGKAGRTPPTKEEVIQINTFQ